MTKCNCPKPDGSGSDCSGSLRVACTCLCHYARRKAPEDMSIRELAERFRIVMRNISETDYRDLLAIRGKRAGALWQEMLRRGFEFKDDGSNRGGN